MRTELDLVYQHDEIADLDPAARRLALRAIFTAAGFDDVSGRVSRVADEIDGFGPISALMCDEDVTDILINGPADVWIERSGSFEQTACCFGSSEHLLAWCERHITRVGGRLDTSHPVADVRLPDGARMHVVIPPIAPHGPLVSIRRFPETALSLEDLVDAGTMAHEEGDALRDAVGAGRSIVISGATGSGKTTLLNALLGLVPNSERVVVIEELPELRVSGGNRVSLVARTANSEGRGRLGLEELVRASLRMRPDRVVIGEVRGGEALPALWAMRTGHAGTMLSVHASGVTDAANRLADLALMAERDIDREALLRDLESGVDIYVHMSRADGKRVVTELLEVR